MRKLLLCSALALPLMGCGATGTLDPANLQVGVNLLGDGYSVICSVYKSEYCSKHNQHIAKKAQAGADGLIGNLPSP